MNKDEGQKKELNRNPSEAAVLNLNTKKMEHTKTLYNNNAQFSIINVILAFQTCHAKFFSINFALRFHPFKSISYQLEVLEVFENKGAMTFHLK